MRALHIYSGNLYGGIEAMLASVARARTVETCSHEFALCFDGRLAGELRAAGAAVHLLGEVRMSRPASIRRARRALADLLQSQRYACAVIHAPWSYALFAGVVRETPVSIVFWAHDVMTGRHWTERLAGRTPPDHVVCNSEFTSTSLAALFNPRPASTVIYPPVEQVHDPLSAGERAVIRRGLQTDDDAVVVATACRSEAWKGHQLLLQSLGRLRDVPNWIWWQIGGAQRPAERDYLRELERLADRQGIAARVRWLGERSDVPQLLRAAGIYCQPNAEPEPFGIAFVEALAAGLPVITTDFGGGREIVDATCGVLVPPGDSDGLAAELKRLVAEPEVRRQLGRAAPARARALCDPATQLHRLSSILEAVVDVLPATVRRRGPQPRSEHSRAHS